MSKGLEALDYLEDIAYGRKMRLIPYQLKKIIEKELKALEIIIKKKVDIKYLYYRAKFNVEKYNYNYIETLTKEECELLRKVFYEYQR